jgi:hypothetical protein
LVKTPVVDLRSATSRQENHCALISGHSKLILKMQISGWDNRGSYPVSLAGGLGFQTESRISKDSRRPLWGWNGISQMASRVRVQDSACPNGTGREHVVAVTSIKIARPFQSPGQTVCKK